MLNPISANKNSLFLNGYQVNGRGKIQKKEETR